MEQKDGHACLETRRSRACSGVHQGCTQMWSSTRAQNAQAQINWVHLQQSSKLSKKDLQTMATVVVSRSHLNGFQLGGRAQTLLLLAIAMLNDAAERASQRLGWQTHPPPLRTSNKSHLAACGRQRTRSLLQTMKPNRTVKAGDAAVLPSKAVKGIHLNRWSNTNPEAIVKTP